MWFDREALDPRAGEDVRGIDESYTQVCYTWVYACHSMICVSGAG